MMKGTKNLGRKEYCSSLSLDSPLGARLPRTSAKISALLCSLSSFFMQNKRQDPESAGDSSPLRNRTLLTYPHTFLSHAFAENRFNRNLLAPARLNLTSSTHFRHKFTSITRNPSAFFSDFRRKFLLMTAFCIPVLENSVTELFRVRS